MRFALASLACLLAAILMLAVRGAANWSHSFAIAWYGIFGSSVILALTAMAVAVAARRAALRRRLTMVALGIPALAGVAALIWLIVTVAPLAD